MRTTLDIDDDVLAAAKERAKVEGTTAGQVISDLARRTLTQPERGEARYRNGFRLLPRTGQVITPEMVDKWLEDDV